MIWRKTTVGSAIFSSLSGDFYQLYQYLHIETQSCDQFTVRENEIVLEKFRIDTKQWNTPALHIVNMLNYQVVYEISWCEMEE